MTIALDENICAVDDHLVFPNVQTCIALVIGSAGGSLAGMHLTIGTSPAQVQSAAQVLLPRLVGPVSVITCIGNMPAFANAHDLPMRFPGALRQTLQAAFQFAGNIGYFDTLPLYQAGLPGGGHHAGLVVTAWRHPETHQIRYSLGPNAAWQPAGHEVALMPVFRIGMLHVVQITGQAMATYTIAGTTPVPELGLGTM